MIIYKVALIIHVVYLLVGGHPDKNFLDLGILHTVERYALWHAKEEKLVKLLAYQLQALILKKRTVSAYLRLYSKTRKQAQGNSLMATQKVSTSIESTTTHAATPLIFRLLLLHKYSSLNSKVRQFEQSPIHSRYRDDIYETLRLIEMQTANVMRGREDNNPSESEHNEFVGSHDMFFTSMGWIHLQEIYLLSPYDLVLGMNIGTKVGGQLTPGQCAQIGMFALLQKRYYMSIEWLEVAIQFSTSDLTLLRALLSLAIQQHNKVGHDILTNNSYNDPINLYRSPLVLDQLPDNRTSVRHVYFERNKGLGMNAGDDEQFMNLCMGNTYESLTQQAKVKCHYDRTRHPYFYISPQKVEQLSEAPPLYQFYDVLSDSFIEKLKETFRKYVKTGVAIGHSINDISARCGTSAGTGLHHNQTPRKFYRISEMVSGLKLLIDPFHDQFVEYTYGRMYRFHMDHSYNRPELLRDFTENGDRFATMLYYLELPMFGGYTPFIDAGVHAHPVKGSAILWFNMYRNGSLRNDVVHGGCPVIYGSKIIMTHFFRYNRNWNKQMCTLNQLE